MLRAYDIISTNGRWTRNKSSEGFRSAHALSTRLFGSPSSGPTYHWLDYLSDGNARLFKLKKKKSHTNICATLKAFPCQSVFLLPLSSRKWKYCRLICDSNELKYFGPIEANNRYRPPSAHTWSFRMWTGQKGGRRKWSGHLFLTLIPQIITMLEKPKLKGYVRTRVLACVVHVNHIKETSMKEEEKKRTRRGALSTVEDPPWIADFCCCCMFRLVNVWQELCFYLVPPFFL